MRRPTSRASLISVLGGTLLVLLLAGAGLLPAGPVLGGTFVNGQPASLVLGQPDFTSSARGSNANGFSSPTGVAVDPTSGKVFVADQGNRRVLRYAALAGLSHGIAAEAVLGQPGFTSQAGPASQSSLASAVAITVDSGGRLWVADTGNHRILRFDSAATKPSGANADGVLGQADFLNGSATVTRARLNGPTSLAVDSSGQLWVADTFNSRVLRFDNAATKANGAEADGVLGQADFTSNAAASSRAGMNSPSGVAVDSSGRLWVADSFNNRVLRFDSAATKPNGANADGVLGQSDFTSNATATTPTGLTSPFGLAADSAGRLWVADLSNHRVLWFDAAASKANGASADGVLGQPDFTSSTPSVTQAGFFLPSGMAVDGVDDPWVVDQGNNRLLHFTSGSLPALSPATTPTTGVTGTPTSTTTATATSTATTTTTATATTDVATATTTPIATGTVGATMTATATGTVGATATATVPGGGPPPPPAVSTDPAATAPFRLYVPLAYKAAGSWDSGIQVQNVGGFDATVYVSYFQNGQFIGTEPAATITAGASKTYYLPAMTTVPGGFNGSVVVGASGPIAGVVNWTNYNVNGSGRSSTTAYNALTLDEAGTTVAVPALRYGNILQVQNAGNAQTTAHITTYNAGGLATATQDVVLNPGQSAAQDLGFARTEPGGAAVSAVVTSTGTSPQPLAVVQWGELQSPAGVPMAVSFGGVVRTAPNLVAPLVMKRPTGWGTELAIQNVGTQTAQVTVQFYDQTGQPVAGANDTQFLPANGSYVSRQAGIAALPADFVGSAVVASTNGQPLALAVLQANPNLNQATSYVGIESASAPSTLYAPLLMKANNGWDTGVQVQNVGSAAATVTITYYARDSFTPVATQSQVIQPNAPFTFFTPDAQGLPATFVGSAVIAAPAGSRIVGVVNEVNYQIGNGGDNSLTYSLVGGQ